MRNPPVSGSISFIDRFSNFRYVFSLVGNPDAIAMAPNGLEVYAANLDGNVNILNTSSSVRVINIRVGGQLTGVALSPNGHLAYVSGSSGVTAIDTDTHRVITTVKVGAQPSAVAFTPDGRYVYVTNKLSNTVNAIDTTTNRVIATFGPESPVEMAGPVAVAITPDGHFAYVASESAAQNNLSILPVAPFVSHITPFFIVAGDKKTVAISGTNLAGATALDFGPNPASSFSCSVSSCTAAPPICVVPDGHITVTTPGGTSPATAADRFTYDFEPRLEVATAGSPYATTVVAPSVSGIPPYHWSIAAGALPAGLSLNATTGIVSGTPNSPGRYDLTFRVVDSQTPPKVTTEDLSVVVQQSSCRHTVSVSQPPRLRITRLRATPLRPGCATESGTDEREITAVATDATCRHFRLTLEGVIDLRGVIGRGTGGTVSERVSVRLPLGPATRTAHARVLHGRWRISLILPGVNLDPIPPSYLIAVKYKGKGVGRTTIQRRIRLESEPAGLQ